VIGWHITSRANPNRLSGADAPQNVSYTPVKESYEIGDVLTCNSDAVPTPTYVWTDLLTSIAYPTQVFTIMADMVGPALFRCQVTNVVGSFNVFVNSTVNRMYTFALL